MSEINLFDNIWMVVFVICILCVVVWTIFVSIRHVRNSFLIGSLDLCSDEYDELELFDLVEASETYRHHH